MGQDAWNLMYGKRHNPKTRKGTEVDMHPDEGFAGSKFIPGYAGAYKNSKTRVLKGKAKPKSLKANANPRTYGSQSSRRGPKYAEENGISSTLPPKKRK